MQYRPFGQTGWNVSTISFGAWAIGGSWGKVNDSDSMKALHEAVERGVNFIDTADVYGDGHSERLVSRLRRERKEELYVATKAGRRLPAQTPDGYTESNLRSWVERSLKNLGVDAIDLLQLHCPPTDVFYRADVFGILDDLVHEGALRHYGVSIERVEEGLKALEFPNVRSVQVVFNLFRQRPAELLLPEAKRRRVAVLARVPLASGLLTGKLSKHSTFAADDHRHFNRNGECFDKGETFGGVDLDAGLETVEALRPLVPHGWTMGQWALRWILMNDAITCAIPGARTQLQAAENCAAADLPPLTDAGMIACRKAYETQIRPLVHHRW